LISKVRDLTVTSVKLLAGEESVDLRTLREDLHRVIDAVIDAHVAAAGGPGNGHVLKGVRVLG
jgi:hypothetical protein